MHTREKTTTINTAHPLPFTHNVLHDIFVIQYIHLNKAYLLSPRLLFCCCWYVSLKIYWDCVMFIVFICCHDLMFLSIFVLLYLNCIQLMRIKLFFCNNSFIGFRFVYTRLWAMWWWVATISYPSQSRWI